MHLTSPYGDRVRCLESVAAPIADAVERMVSLPIEQAVLGETANMVEKQLLTDRALPRGG